uniref:Uncharacterized protein n=1 Tax=Rhizophora mucronata TaxID=61149 RepID=A0A2P2P9F8_RHIMU
MPKKKHVKNCASNIQPMHYTHNVIEFSRMPFPSKTQVQSLQKSSFKFHFSPHYCPIATKSGPTSANPIHQKTSFQGHILLLPRLTIRKQSLITQRESIERHAHDTQNCSH